MANEPIPVNDTYTRDQVIALRDDFKDFTKEMRGLLRVITDPESGYVPRAEIDARFKSMSDGMWRAATFSIAAAGVVATVISLITRH